MYVCIYIYRERERYIPIVQLYDMCTFCNYRSYLEAPAAERVTIIITTVLLLLLLLLIIILITITITITIMILILQMKMIMMISIIRDDMARGRSVPRDEWGKQICVYICIYIYIYI